MKQPWHLWAFLERAPRLEILYHSIHYLDTIRALAGEPRGVYCRAVAHPCDARSFGTRAARSSSTTATALRCSLLLNHTHQQDASHSRVIPQGRRHPGRRAADDGRQHRLSRTARATRSRSRSTGCLAADRRCGARGSSKRSRGRCRICSDSWPAKTTRSCRPWTTRSGRWRSSKRVTSRAPQAGHRYRKSELADCRIRRWADSERHAYRFSPAFLALQRGGVRLDRRFDGSAAPRLSAGRPATRDGPCAASTRAWPFRRGRRSKRPAGCSSWPRRSPFIAGVVGWVDLQADDVAAQVEQFAAHPKLVGVRHIVQSEPDDRFLLRPGVLPRHFAARRSRPHLRHPDLSAAPARCGRARLAFQAQRFVLDHLAKPEIRAGEIREWEQGIRELAKVPNVFCKVSGLVTEADWNRLDAGSRFVPISTSSSTALARIGCLLDRIGRCARWPPTTREPCRSLSDYLDKRPASERDAVMGGNAARFWRLPAGELV